MNQKIKLCIAAVIIITIVVVLVITLRKKEDTTKPPSLTGIVTNTTTSGPTGTGTTTGGPADIVFASDVIPSIKSGDWKLVLPVDINGNDSTKATTLTQRNIFPLSIRGNALIDKEMKPYFYVEANEVVLRAPCGGATSAGTNYPRCELRQLVNKGDNFWSTNKLQTLETELRITETPVAKPDMSIVQIHSQGEPQVLAVLYRKSIGIYLLFNETEYTKTTPIAYTIGDRLNIRVVVDKGVVNCTIKNINKNTTFNKTFVTTESTGAFQIGAYVLSSMFLNGESPSAAGEVRIKYLDIKETL